MNLDAIAAAARAYVATGGPAEIPFTLLHVFRDQVFQALASVDAVVPDEAPQTDEPAQADPPKKARPKK